MRRKQDASATSRAAENQDGAEVRGPGVVGGRASRRGGWFVAVVAGCLIALVSGATGFPPSSAFAVLDEDPGDGSSTASTTSTTLLNPSDIDTSTGDDQIDSQIDGAKTTIDGTLDAIVGEGTGPRLHEEEEQAPEDETPGDDGDDENGDPEGDDENGDPEGDEDGDPDDDGEAEEEEEEESPAPPRTRNSLSTLRTIDISSAVPIVEVSSPLGRLPFEGFIDIPLGPRTTRDIVDLLTPLGISGEGLCEVLAPFPVCGPAKYSNDWNAPRHTPYFHAHEGTDIFAPRNTPVISPTDGVVDRVRHDSAIGGNSLWVVDRAGTSFYFAHLEDFARDIADGAIVRAGEVLGGVGDSGNAVGTPPHLHFEVHPGGGEAQPPLPYLDQWLSQARARAQQIAGIEPQVAPQTADSYSPFQPPVPQAGLFEPAASERTESPAATVALLLIIGVGVLVFRRRHTLLLPVRIAVAGVVPDRFRRRRVPVRNLLTMPWDLSEGDEMEAASRDVLAPLLRERDRKHEDDRELESVGADR